jgi:hypothetical protein
MAHGFEIPGLGGGYGVALCQEGLTLQSIGLLAPLHGQIHGGIVLFSCGAAHIAPTLLYPDGRVLFGDGNILCSRLAQITGTWVRAGTMDQNGILALDGTLGSTPWRGVVLNYAPSGAVISVDIHPTELQARQSYDGL